ncbi:hypothetical protein GGD83_003504 [Rhodoblastus sphagnicola]|nr:hypothetical protein [Rhodoblastus sphagnicola]MBB4199683.1 hypothetical protein [Rhodoblastus sphagnicola]
MTALPLRKLLACSMLACSALAFFAAPVLAQDHGRVRLESGLRAGLATDARSLFAAPLPPGPDFSRSGSRAVSAYAPEQRVRLKQMNFVGDQ